MTSRRHTKVREKCRRLGITWKDDPGIAGILLEAADCATDEDASAYLDDAMSVLQRAQSGDLDPTSVRFDRLLGLANRARREAK
jgi:hypothetical protein